MPLAAPPIPARQAREAFSNHLKMIRFFVMAGLVPAIHAFLAQCSQDVDARHKAGHDELTTKRSFRLAAFTLRMTAMV